MPTAAMRWHQYRVEVEARALAGMERAPAAVRRVQVARVCAELRRVIEEGGRDGAQGFSPNADGGAGCSWPRRWLVGD